MLIAPALFPIHVESHLETLCKIPLAVMPVKTGIQFNSEVPEVLKFLIPAFARMTNFYRASFATNRKSVAAP